MRVVKTSNALLGACVVTICTVIGATEARASEPRDDPPLECAGLSVLWGVAEAECGLRECSDLEPAAERASRSRHSARCAARYDEFLGMADKCSTDLEPEVLFNALTTTLDLWETAYTCMPDYMHSLYLAEIIEKLDREIAVREEQESERAHIESLKVRRERITQLVPPHPAEVCPPPVEPPAPSTDVSSPVLDMFTLRVSTGLGHVLSFVETAASDRSVFKGRDVSIAGSISVGAQVTLADAGLNFAGAEEHFVELGLSYAALGGRLKLEQGMDLHELEGEAFRWVHHLGGFARYGYRIHAEHADLYIEAGGGFQVVTMGANLGTPFGRGGIGVCSLWRLLCVDAGYIHGWGGALPKEQKTNFVSAARVMFGTDVLRIPRVIRARKGRR